MILYLVSICLLLFTIFYIFMKNRYKLWSNLNIPFIKPSFPVGNIEGILSTKTHFAYLMADLYERSKHLGDCVGIFFFHYPVLLVTSIEFAKKVLISDFQYFANRGVYYNEKDDPLSANLFFLEGLRWKNLRHKLTPTFTSGNMKMMFYTMFGVTNELVKFLEKSVSDNKPVEISEVFSRFTTDVIVTCAFGIECNSLFNPASKLRSMGKRILHFSKLKALKIFFSMMFRKQAVALGLRFNDVDVCEFFSGTIRSTIDYREKNNIVKNDFMNLMIQLKNKGYLENDLEAKTQNTVKLTFEEVAAQSFLFFVAGFDTSSNTMSFAIHQLAIYEEYQDRAREEINDVLEQYNGELSYESLSEMKYLDKIISESLRMFPPVASLHRIATQDYKLPNGSILKEGTGVIISNIGFQNDPDIFPKPHIFDPERFSKEAKASRDNFYHMPFGEGPRVCIGMRFGLMQTKLGLASILRKYKFTICEKTVMPMVVDTIALVLKPKDGVWLNIEQI